MRTLVIVPAVGLLLLAWSMPAHAQLVPVETETETSGATTVQWNSGFLFQDYDCSTIELTEADLGIMVSAGEAAFDTFLEKENQGRGKNNPITPVSTPNKPKAEGEIAAADTALITFHQLHGGDGGQVLQGTAHLWWQGMVDEDGEEGTEATAKYGVNVHVERAAVEGNCPAP